ncbi:MAG: hypothetical protein KC535_06045 [Nanoarchaeota archaeon]|nr:hypothetical protein [Nanoarchaeota archaeon]
MNFIPGSYNPGLLGKNYDASRLMMVLHFSDSRAPIPHEEEGYREALLASQTGRVLKWILEESKISLDDLFVTNYVKGILPDDKPPTKQEYDVSKPLLLEQIELYQPKKIVLFGAPVYSHFFEDTSAFQEVTYSVREFDHIPVLVSEHPGYIHRLLTEKRKERISLLSSFLTNN